MEQNGAWNCSILIFGQSENKFFFNLARFARNISYKWDILTFFKDTIILKTKSKNLKCFCIECFSRISGGFGDFYTMKRSQDNLSEAYLAQILRFLGDDQLRGHDYYWDD